jgi:hypothetical protein
MAKMLERSLYQEDYYAWTKDQAAKLRVETELAKLFGRGRRDAAFGLEKHGEHQTAKTLPAACPYTFGKIVSHDWYPASRHQLTDPTDAADP